MNPDHKRLSIARQCDLLTIQRSSYYYQPCAVSGENLELMRLIDEQYLKTPCYGARQMARYLRRQGYCVSRKRIGRLLGELLDELHIGHADGSYRQQLSTLAKRKLLILDDWGMEALTARQANDLLDVMEIRYQQSSTIIASQIPTSEWYKLIPSPTIADALLDRLLHNSHRIELTGESMRKLDQSDHLA